MSYVVAVIPARYASNRFPGKPLVSLGGLPMVVRTAFRASEAESIQRVYVATEDRRIGEVCAEHGVDVVMTSCDHLTGTDRVAEAANAISADLVFNLQGDEPLIDPKSIDALVDRFLEDHDVEIGTAACPMTEDEARSPHTASVAVSVQSRLLFLSRHPIPYSWGAPQEHLRHIGMYIFTRSALNRFVSRKPGPLEQSERIEIFRFLEYGEQVALVEISGSAPGVDIPEDVERVEAYAAEQGGWPRSSI